MVHLISWAFVDLQVGALEETIACWKLSCSAMEAQRNIVLRSEIAGEYSHLKVDCTMSSWGQWPEP